jgi:nitroimidazol reductase NimA-like FMN-containing flavoprotein (pyridoxamine 5'-phosphate oxidase superfamily)
MSISAGAWRLPDWRGQVQVLDVDECVHLLTAHHVGRVAYCTESGPRVVPMNYALAGNTLAFRTGHDTEAARYLPGAPVAFEVDDIDEFLQAAWSVVVQAHAEFVPAETLRLMDRPQFPQPWAPGNRSMVFQLSLDNVSGRRIHPS